MSSGKEIISFQLGHFSNFVGAHWWNLQEAGFEYGTGNPSEINHDVLFREGLTHRGEVTFTPRLLLVDLKGSLSSLSRRGDLYEQTPDPSPNIVQWHDDKVEVLQSPEISKTKFQEDLETGAVKNHGDKEDKYNFEEDVAVWSNYLHTRYHPRTVNLVNEYEHGSETIPFDIFNYGSSLWKTEPFQEDFTDLIRNYAEECDNMQGFQVLLDSTDGFAGLGTALIQHLNDEYSTKSIIAFPLIPSAIHHPSPLKSCIRSINLAAGYEKLAEHSSIFVPLCTGSTGWKEPGPPRRFPHINYNEQLPYHSSALLASALDTFSLRYRLHSGSASSMADLVNSLGYLGRKAVAASMGLPFAMQQDGYLFDTLEKSEEPLWESLSPNCVLDDDHMWIQSVTLRGVPHNRLRRPETSSTRAHHQHPNNPAYHCKTREEMLSLYLRFKCYSTASHVTVVDSPSKVTTPYPRFFAKRLRTDGTISAEEPQVSTSDTKSSVESVPVMAGLHSCRGIGDMLESLYTEAKKIPFKRCKQFIDAGLEGDEYRECLDHLASLRECYMEVFD